MDDETTVITLCRDYGLPTDTAYAMRALAAADTFANGPGDLVLIAWPAPVGGNRYAVARWDGS